MIQLLIVDDQEVVRRGIVKMINELRLDDCRTFEAGNGYEALFIAQEREPDIILTDIIMPDMDGLEMIEELRRRNSRARIIIVSAYSNFDYAQKAIAFRVDGYMLKPVGKNDLCRQLMLILEDIANNSENHERLIKKEQQYYFMLLYEYLSGRDVLVSPSLLYENTGLHCMRRPYFCVALFSFSGGDATEIAHFAEKLNKRFTSGGTEVVSFGTGGRQVIMILNSATERELSMLTELISDYLSHVFTNCRCGVSSAQKDIGILPELYRQAEIALKNCIVLNYPVYVYTDVGSLLETLFTDRDYEMMHRLIINGNEEEYFFRLDRLFISLAREKLSLKDCAFILNIYADHLIQLLKSSIPWFTQDLAVDFSSAHTLLSMKAAMHAFFKGIFEDLNAFKPNASDDAVGYLKNYINNNYGGELSLTKLANELNLNYYYVSGLFSRQVGVSFTEYVTRIRLEKAREMLYGGQRVSEVAARVGFKDTKYFYRVFKRFYGTSPRKIE